MKNRLENCLLVPRDDEILFAFDGDDVRCNLHRMAIVPIEDYEHLKRAIKGGIAIMEEKDEYIAELEAACHKTRKTLPEYNEAISAVCKENEKLEAENELLRAYYRSAEKAQQYILEYDDVGPGATAYYDLLDAKAALRE